MMGPDAALSLPAGQPDLTDPGDVTTVSALVAQRAWNATRAEYPAACIHQLVELHAARTPASLALADSTAEISYWQLSQRSNQLAHYLLGLGARPDTPVAVCMERSVDLVVTLLGILKAGAAYLPLDPAYPAERLAFMLGDSRAPIVLTQGALRPLLPDPPGPARLVALDDMAALLADQPPTLPPSPVEPEV